MTTESDVPAGNVGIAAIARPEVEIFDLDDLLRIICHNGNQMTKPINHHVVDPGAARTPGPTEAVRSAKVASTGTSTDFRSLLASSLSESHHDPQAKNKRSSATGAYQFTERTWLDLIKRHGAELGMGDVAAHIKVKDGVPTVANPADRTAILALRNNSDLAGTLAARYFDENRAALGRTLGRTPNENEVRMAYLLGASGATRLLKAAKDHPTLTVDEIVPGAVRANPTLFHNRDGAVKTASEAVSSLNRHFTTTLHSASGTAGSQLSSLLANEVADDTA
ncbi:MAG: hypothetical protein JWL84_508 [Rhodospirillales bacterium]|jgi:hypothetical protein|nr:hypothetical protein [Rhodospirillales bacterium]